MPTTGRPTYTKGELREVAAGLQRLLGAIERGDLSADSGVIARLEGAAAAIQALAEAARTEAPGP